MNQREAWFPSKLKDGDGFNGLGKTVQALYYKSYGRLVSVLRSGHMIVYSSFFDG
jgi:hypothetical protein